MDGKLYSRHAEQSLRHALEMAPVVLIHGPRQCGKTTLARMLGKELGHQYFSFDRPHDLEFAEDDPEGFVNALPEKVILDEIQRVPELFSVIKMEVDRLDIPGRFILAGSANVMSLPKLSDSLAGRMTDLRLHPLSQAELSRRPSHFINNLFAGTFDHWAWPDSDSQIAQRIVAGGYPRALQKPDEKSSRGWYLQYIQRIIQRDVRELARIRSSDIFRSLLKNVANQTAQLLNINKLSSSLNIDRSTATHHVTLLEQMFLIERLNVWHGNMARRLTKTPKMHLCDTGIACALLGLDTKRLQERPRHYGFLLETFVFQELLRQSEGPGEEEFSFYRDRDQAEVDIVIQRGWDEIIGVEVKASSIVREADFRSLKKLRNKLGSRFKRGVILHDSEYPRDFGDRLFSVPIRMLWESSDAS